MMKLYNRLINFNIILNLKNRLTLLQFYSLQQNLKRLISMNIEHLKQMQNKRYSFFIFTIKLNILFKMRHKIFKYCS